VHFIELLTRKYQQQATNLIYNTKSLEDHFNSDMFRWHIYQRHQGESSTESWNKSCLPLPCTIHAARQLQHPSATVPCLDEQCDGHCRSAYTVPAVLYEHEFLWSDSGKVYIARRTLPYQRCSNFLCERSSWWRRYIRYRNMSELKWSSNDFVLCIRFVHCYWYFPVNNTRKSSIGARADPCERA
jgi:hypothetical protein